METLENCANFTLIFTAVWILNILDIYFICYPSGKEESQMLGVYFLYFNQLLGKRKAKGLAEKYEGKGL